MPMLFLSWKCKFYDIPYLNYCKSVCVPIFFKTNFESLFDRFFPDVKRRNSILNNLNHPSKGMEFHKICTFNLKITLALIDDKFLKYLNLKSNYESSW
jgi:hypothetical protein